MTPLLGRIAKESGAALSPLPAAASTARRQSAVSRQHFAVQSLAGFGGFHGPEIAALGALLNYIGSPRWAQTPHLRPPRQDIRRRRC